MRLVLHLARWWSARHYLLRTGPFAKAQSVWKKPFITHKDNKCSGPTNNDAILNSLSWYTCYLTLYKALIIKSRLHSFSSCWRGASHNHLVRGTRNLHGPWFRLVRGALQASLRGGMKWCCSKHFVFGGAGKIHGEMRGKRGKEMQPYCWGCGMVTSDWITPVRRKEMNTWGRAWMGNPYPNPVWPSGADTPCQPKWHGIKQRAEILFIEELWSTVTSTCWHFQWVSTF